MQTFAVGQTLVIDARLAGLAAAVVALLLKAPFLVVVVVAAVTAAAPARDGTRHMSTPRKPIFGFLWPRPDPNAPVDEAYRQVRGVRVAPRGPIRLTALVIATLLTISAMGSMLMTVLRHARSPR